MHKPTLNHLGCGLVVALLSAAAWWCGWPICMSATFVLMLDLYLIAVLIEAANRATKPRMIDSGVLAAKPKWKIELPLRTWSLLQVWFLVAIAVFGFASMYLQGGAVINAKALLTNKLDAIYSSVVTITTLGYGDFVPTGDARLLVVWQLGTGLLLLIGIFPLVIARISDF